MAPDAAVRRLGVARSGMANTRPVILVAGVGWLVGLLASGAACRRQAATPPLATPSLGVQRARVTQGSPVDLTYRFVVAPDARFDQSYRVFVHFLDADDELMWTDDHDPPKPTTAWKPGETIEYTRTLFVPIYPYIGQATIRMGLYSPRDGSRVPLAGDDNGQRAYRVGSLEIAPQTENIFLIFKDGWHQPEVAPDNPALEWQWSKKDATFAFRNPKQDVLFYLHLDGRPAVLAAPQQVTVSVRDVVVETLALTEPGDLIRRIPISAAVLGADEMVEVRIHVEPTFVPALTPGGNRQDARELGIRVFHAYVEPRAAAPSP
jgi:hypothetical protein